jgi:hypothetical protein
MPLFKVENISGDTVALPAPYRGALANREIAVLTAASRSVLAEALGGAAAAKAFHVTLTVGGDVATTHDAVPGVAAGYAIRQAFAAGVGATADDVVIYNANAPFALRILDAQLLVKTAVAVSTATLRNATGGGGSPLSDDFDTTAAVRVRDAGAAVQETQVISLGGTLVLRRSKNTVAGEVILLVTKA